MDGRIAGFIFLGVCVVLAGLLFAGTISPLTGGALFAAALVLLGGGSRGFRRRKDPSR